MGHGGERRRKKEETLGGLILERRGYLRRELLGKGAFSDVYTVEHRVSGRICACKISREIGLLEREARVMAVVKYPLFPEYYAFWQEAGLGFLLMENVAGRSLEEFLARRGHFTVRQTVRAGMILAEGLLYLHQRPERFLFRDIKPSNIMIRQDGNLKLIDFGCVCSMEGRQSSRAGTPGYAAPEQLEGSISTSSCDVHGLGRTLQEMLGKEEVRRREVWGGKRRYGRGQNVMRYRQQKMLRHLLERCTKKAAEERIADMNQVILQLKQLKVKECTEKNTKN